MKIADLNLTEFQDYPIPKVHEALGVQVVERIAARPILMTFLSPYKEFTNALGLWSSLFWTMAYTLPLNHLRHSP